MSNTKHIKNPLRKRVLRDIRREKGKYISIFLFLTLMIAIVSGMLVTSSSMIQAYDNGIEDYRMEDGHFALNADVKLSDLQEIAADTDEPVTIFEQLYYDIDYSFDGNSDYSIRLYKNRQAINTYSVFEGHAPEADGELAIDRLFAENNDLTIGDTLTVADKELTICGLVAVPDYSCLFEKNSDSMFNASTFTMGFVTDSYFEEFPESKLVYGYAYRFDNRSLDDQAAYDASTELMETFGEKLIENGNYLTDFLMRQNNKAITFTKEDMEGDSTGTVLMLYILIVLLAFIYGLMTFSTIEKESGAIGTLRASGYSRGEIIRHYMTAPIIIMILAAIIGNILGYSCLQAPIKELYYHSYSLPVYKVIWNADAFVMTTVVPLVLLVIINYAVLYSKIKLSPLAFLRHDLSKRKKKRVKKLPNFRFFTRFRLRTILQNLPNYITMFIGIFMANVLFVFSAGFLPILENHTDNVMDHLLSDYQYTLSQPAETENENAEKFCMTGLETKDEMEVLAYGLSGSSRYMTGCSLPENKGEVLISTALLKLEDYAVGDTLTLYKKYSDDSYTFTIKGTYEYPASMAVFMTTEAYNEVFENDSDYYTGYLSDEKLTDLGDDVIYNVMTPADYTKLVDQLNDSMGRMMPLMEGLSLINFVLVIYLLSKVVLEKNAEAISLTKILGYNNAEISRIYIVSTAIAVILSVAISLPLVTWCIKFFYEYMLATFGVWIDVRFNAGVYIKTVVLDLVCYGLLSLLQFRKIKQIPMEEALKNRE